MLLFFNFLVKLTEYYILLVNSEFYNVSLKLCFLVNVTMSQQVYIIYSTKCQTPGSQINSQFDCIGIGLHKKTHPFQDVLVISLCCRPFHQQNFQLNISTQAYRPPFPTSPAFRPSIENHREQKH